METQFVKAFEQIIHRYTQPLQEENKALWERVGELEELVKGKERYLDRTEAAKIVGVSITTFEKMYKGEEGKRLPDGLVMVSESPLRFLFDRGKV